MSPPRSVRTWRPMLRIRPSWRTPSGLDSSHFSRSCCRWPLLFRERVLLDVFIARFDTAGDTALEAFRGCCPRARGCSGCGSTTSSRCRARWTQLLGPRDVVDDDRAPEAVVEVLVDLPAVPQRQEDAAQAAAVRGEHLLGDAAEREHLAVEGDFALIARPRTGRPVNADTGAATIVTPAEVPSLGASPERTRRCRSVSRCQAGSRPCRAAGRVSRAVPRPGGRQRARHPPRSSTVRP